MKELITNKKLFFSILPTAGKSHSEQFEDCMRQLVKNLSKIALPLKNILRLSVFINAKQQIYSEIKNVLIEVLKKYFKDESPSVSIIGQPPADGYLATLEAVVQNKHPEFVSVKRISLENINYTKVEYSDYIEIHAAGLSGNNINDYTYTNSKDDTLVKEQNISFLRTGLLKKNKSLRKNPLTPFEKGGKTEIPPFSKGVRGFLHSLIRRNDNSYSIYNQSKAAFEQVKQVLINEELEFSDIIRQWNYIENILEKSQTETGLLQNYQIFNDVRSLYYGSSLWQNGYPAATGIGMNCGGVIIDFIAVKLKSNSRKSPLIIPIQNPRQTDAHRYSQEVLVGESISDVKEKTSPKFERAKLLLTDNSTEIFISGTAAILGQNTIEEQDIETQTITTIENMLALIKQIHHMTSSHRMNSIRAYIKKNEDVPIVKKICEKYFPNVTALYVISDICRDDLLVEIEGILT